MLVGHRGCGKTSLVQSLQEVAGNVDRPERTHEGNIELAVSWCVRNETKIDLIDTPGDRSFAAEAEVGAWVADVALVVVGEDVFEGTERAFELATRYALPTAIMASGTLTQKRKSAIADLAPAALVLMTDFADPSLVEAVAASDDELLERYLQQDGLSEVQVQEGFVNAFNNRKLVPVLSDEVSLLLDQLALLAVKQQRASEEAVSAKVFKVLETPMGQMTLLRVCSGVLRPNTTLINRSRERELRVGMLYAMVGRQRTPMSEAHLGELVGFARIPRNAARIGETLHEREGQPFAPPQIPPSVLVQVRIDASW